MDSISDFYRKERRREPAPEQPSTPIEPAEQVASVARSDSLSPRRASAHAPSDAAQCRRPSISARSFTRGLLISDLAPAALSHTTASTIVAPAVASSVAMGSRDAGAANIEKPTEKAIDPRRRPDRASPSLQSANPTSPAIASPLAREPPQRISTLSKTTSAANSPVPSDDIDMTDAVEPSSGDDLTRALISLIEDGFATALRKHQKSQAREELENASKEYAKVKENFKNYPPLLEHTESARNNADQKYKALRKKAFQSSQACNAKAGEVAKTIAFRLNQIAEQSRPDQVPVDPSQLRAEMRPWTERLAKLEQHLPELSHVRETQQAVDILKDQFLSLERKLSAQQTQAGNGDVDRLWANVKILDETVQDMRAKLDKSQEDNQKVEKYLDEDIRSLFQQTRDIKADLGYAKDKHRVLDDATRELFKRDEEKTILLTDLKQENKELRTELKALRNNSATRPDIEVVKRELSIYRGAHASRPDVSQLRKDVDALQETALAKTELTALLKSHDAAHHNTEINTDPPPMSESNLKTEINAALSRIGQLEKELAEVRKMQSEPTIPRDKTPETLAQSNTFFEYVERYEHDMNILNTRLAEIEQHQTQYQADWSGQLTEHKSAIDTRLRGLTDEVESVDNKVVSQQAVVALLRQDLGKLITETMSMKTEIQARNTNNPSGPELTEALAAHAHQTQFYNVQQRLQEQQNIQSGGVSQAWTEAINNRLKELQQILAALGKDMAKAQLRAANAEHSILALTTRYDNLSSEQLVKRMTHHLNTIPAALQAEQNSMKLRMDELQKKQEETSTGFGSIATTVKMVEGRFDKEWETREKFETRLKADYYDVLESRTKEACQDLDHKIEKLRTEQDASKITVEGIEARLNELEISKEARQEMYEAIKEIRTDQDSSKTAIEGIEERLNELERNSLLNAFQQPTNQKPSPPPGVTIRGRLESNSHRSLANRTENPSTLSRNYGKRELLDLDTGDSITEAPEGPAHKRGRLVK